MPKLLIAIAIAGLVSPVVRAAEPFMDGAPGHCLLCAFFAPRASAKSQADNCAKPDQISQSHAKERRDARSDGTVAN
jgi:hypothetical protein